MSNVKTQVKFKIDPDILSVFKARCASEGVSMTSVIQGWMKARYPPNGTTAKTLNKPQRRKTVLGIIGILNDVLGNEEQYRDLIPEQFAQRYEDADRCCEKVSEAISCLEDAF